MSERDSGGTSRNGVVNESSNTSKTRAGTSIASRHQILRRNWHNAPSYNHSYRGRQRGRSEPWTTL